MFIPSYQLTPKLLNNITQIERLYGQLEALRIPQKLLLNLERNNLIQSAYVSNSIEGNPLSLPEVTNLLLNDRIPVNRDEKEVRNYFDILSELEAMDDQPLTLSTMLTLHQQLLTSVDDPIAGQIRDKKVVVGKYITKDGQTQIQVKHEPPWHTRIDIEPELRNLCAWLSAASETAILKAGIFHHQFVFVHPFEDGNGRVCRLLTALLLLQSGYKINKYFVLDDFYDVSRPLYSDMLHTADSGDKTQWLEYFSDGVMYSLQSAKAKIEAGLDQLDFEDRLTPREQHVLDIVKQKKQLTSTQLADAMAISRQQAHRFLASLTNKGFVEKKGSTKSSYYMLQ